MTVTAPTFSPTQSELGALLNKAVLRLSPDLRVAMLSSERIALKYQPGRRYMVVTPEQWNTLQEFKSGSTVTAVLCRLITNQRNPSLRELYELVAKATQTGVLQSDTWPVPPAETPVKWTLRLRLAGILWFTGLLFIGAVVSVVMRPPELSNHLGWLALGWLAVGVAASIGTGLGASIVTAAGGDIYRLRVVWKTPVPHLTAKLGDALLGGRTVVAGAALARLAPHFALLIVVAWSRPEMLVPVLAGTLGVLSPLWRSPLLDLLGALYRIPQLATDYDFVLGRDLLYRFLTRARLQLGDRKFLLAAIGATAAWLTLVLLTADALLQMNVVTVFESFQSRGGVHYTKLALLGLSVVLVLGVIGFTGWIMATRMRTWLQERSERKQRPAAVLVSPQTIADWLGRTVLFRDLPGAELAAVAAVVKPEEHKRGSFVVREGEPGEKLYIVLSGRLEVRRDYAPGRSEPVTTMEEGDVFGEIALLQAIPRTRSVRSLERSVLLALDKADFERLVLAKISREVVADAVQKVGFLQRVELTRHWNHAMLASYARRSKVLEAPENAVIVEEGKANYSFYLVHRGEVSVRVGGHEVRRLKVGDSFGELSLLGSGIATASVVVCGKHASVLEISARDFLDFIAADFMVGLAWEGVRKNRKER